MGGAWAGGEGQSKRLWLPHAPTRGLRSGMGVSPASRTRGPGTGSREGSGGLGKPWMGAPSRTWAGGQLWG